MKMAWSFRRDPDQFLSSNASWKIKKAVPWMTFGTIFRR